VPCSAGYILDVRFNQTALRGPTHLATMYFHSQVSSLWHPDHATVARHLRAKGFTVITPSIPSNLTEALPKILAHRDRPIAFSPPHWRKHLDPKSSDAIEVLAETECSDGDLPTIARARLVSYVQGLDLDDPRQRNSSFVSAMIWGGGPPRRPGRAGGDPRAPWRTAASLTSTRSRSAEETLGIALAGVRDGDLVAAYLAVTSLHRIGGSFGTKWLWLVGAAESLPDGPLVWDSVIVSWLKTNCARADRVHIASRGRFPSRSKGDALRYSNYVATMHAWADELKLGRGPMRRGALLESYMFSDR